MSTPSLASVAALDCQVLVVGAGPAGLMLANLLGARGITTIVVERRTGPPTESMAIGITPPSLEILGRIGLDRAFLAEGVTVRAAEVHEAGELTGRLVFDGLRSDFPFILSLSQSRTIELLRRGLTRYPCVRVFAGAEFVGYEECGGLVFSRLRESATGVGASLSSHFLAACDGHRSAVRCAAGIGVTEKRYPQRWVMGDFDDASGLGSEARLFFSADGSVESFPLPGGRRRWIAQVAADSPADAEGFIISAVKRIAGHDLAHSQCSFVSRFGAKRMLARRYHQGRVALCGDAAHVMSSVGGQGMNTGFADADMLAAVLARALGEPALLEEQMALYGRVRRRAYGVAADRAACSMWLGTGRGRVFSALRRLFVRHCLFSRRVAGLLAPHFAMLTIPSNEPWLARIAAGTPGPQTLAGGAR